MTGLFVLTHQFKIGASTEEIVSLSEQLSDLCRNAGINSDDVLHVRMALVEALNNVAEHAYENVESRQIDVKLNIDTGYVQMEICDSGLPNLRGVMPVDYSLETEDPDLLPEGGFGFHIINSVMDEVVYSSQNGINRLRLVKYRS